MSILRGENKKNASYRNFFMSFRRAQRAMDESCRNNEGAHRVIRRLRSVRFAPRSALRMT